MVTPVAIVWDVEVEEEAVDNTVDEPEMTPEFEEAEEEESGEQMVRRRPKE